MGHFALDEHSFNYVSLWTLLVLPLSLYYTIYLEIDLEEGKIQQGWREPVVIHVCPVVVMWCLEAPPYLALVGDGLMLGVVGAAGT